MEALEKLFRVELPNTYSRFITDCERPAKTASEIDVEYFLKNCES